MKVRYILPQLALLGTLAAGFSSSALAADGDSGWYGTANIGHSNAKSNNADSAFANQGVTSSSTLDKSDTNYSLGAGYQFNRNFALEGGYVNLGKFKLNGTASSPSSDSLSGKYKADGWNLTAVGILPIDQKLSVYGKAGVILANTKLEASSGTGAVAVSGSSKNSTNGTYGLGVSYAISKNLLGRAEWNRYQGLGDSGSTGKLDIDTYTAGVAMRF